VNHAAIVSARSFWVRLLVKHDGCGTVASGGVEFSFDVVNVLRPRTGASNSSEISDICRFLSHKVLQIICPMKKLDAAAKSHSCGPYRGYTQGVSGRSHTTTGLLGGQGKPNSCLAIEGKRLVSEP
jgi:hypothetical protein